MWLFLQLAITLGENFESHRSAIVSYLLHGQHTLLALLVVCMSMSKSIHCLQHYQQESVQEYK
jgi:hypothetical protein